MRGASLLGRLKTSLTASAGQVVFGMEDGTVSIFGLVFGVAATTNDQSAVLIAGASGAVAAAVSMMAGTYLDVETNRDQARVLTARIEADLRSGSTAVLESVTQRLQAAGMPRDQEAIVSNFLSAQPTILKGVATALTASADSDLSQGPLVQSLWMLVADFFAAAVPILPFAFLPVPQGRVISGIVTMLLLIGLGIGRGLIGNRNILRTVFETVSIGVAAALAGVAIGIGIAAPFRFGLGACAPAAALRIKDTARRRRIICKLCRRPDRTWREITAAVRANAFEPIIHTIAAERALEGADHGVGRRRRQILVAAFATGTQFEHHYFVSRRLLARTRFL